MDDDEIREALERGHTDSALVSLEAFEDSPLGRYDAAKAEREVALREMTRRQMTPEEAHAFIMNLPYEPPPDALPQPWTNMSLANLSELGHYLTLHHAETLHEVMDAGGDLAQAALRVLTASDERADLLEAEIIESGERD